MKKYFIIAALFMLAACGQKSATQSQSQDSIAQEQTEEKPAYKSVDLQLFDLYGYVDSVVMDYHTDCFDANGNLCTEGVNIERNADGRIEKYVYGSIESVGDMWYEENYAYNAFGQLTEKERTCIFYHEAVMYYYDESGRLFKSDSKSFEEGEEWHLIRNYSYLEYDEHGNWTKRKVEAPEEDASIEERQIYYRN